MARFRVGRARTELPGNRTRCLQVWAFAGQAVKVCSDTLIQRHIPDDRLGRVFSIFDMSVNIALVAGITVVAFLAPLNGIAPGLYLAVGGGLALSGVWYLKHR